MSFAVVMMMTIVAVVAMMMMITRTAMMLLLWQFPIGVNLCTEQVYSLHCLETSLSLTLVACPVLVQHILCCV